MTIQLIDLKTDQSFCVGVPLNLVSKDLCTIEVIILLIIKCTICYTVSSNYHLDHQYIVWYLFQNYNHTNKTRDSTDMRINICSPNRWHYCYNLFIM